MTEPLDFHAAVVMCRRAAEAQHNAEKWYATKCREWAEAEKLYREALAKEILRIKADHPATVATDLARGTKHVAELKYQRDLAEGLRDAASQSIWRHTASRKDAQEILDWSKRAAFLDLETPIARRVA